MNTLHSTPLHSTPIMSSSIPSTNPIHFLPKSTLQNPPSTPSLFHSYPHLGRHFHSPRATHKGISVTSHHTPKPPTFNPTLQNPCSTTPSHFHFYPRFHHHLHPPRKTHKGISVTSNNNNNPKVPTFNDKQQQQQQVEPVKTVLWVLFWATVSIAVYAFSKDPAKAAAAAAAAGGGGGGGGNSIKASGFGLRIAGWLRGLGWPDEVVVLCLATLPVIELRGAIPVGYWMKLHPFLLTLLSVFGNMLPVPFIILYLKKLATFLAGRSRTLSRFLDMLFERAKNKAGPVEEFQWLGLMLFVAVPFPGTGAWTGAIIASVLDMPFWQAMSANFFGVVLAGLLVNLLVNLGLKYAIITGVFLFFVSTFMWSILRGLSKSLAPTE